MSHPVPGPSEKPRCYNSLNKPVIVGLYGVSGTGKSFLMKHLEQQLGQGSWRFYDGSAIIDKYAPGGLKGFKAMERGAQYYHRGKAIEDVEKECRKNDKAAVVAGHLMFWEEDRSEEKGPDDVHTEKDLAVYTHMIYLWSHPKVIVERRNRDLSKERQEISEARLLQWQNAEVSMLRRLCLEHGILFSTIGPGDEKPGSQQESPMGQSEQAVILLGDFLKHTEKHNSQKAEDALKKALEYGQSGNKTTILALDADKTLAADDAGRLFWDRLTSKYRPELIDKPWLTQKVPFKELFDTLGYSYTAFRQLTLLSEDFGSDQLYDQICQEIADKITMHPEILTLLRLAAGHKDVGAVVITSGMTRVWGKVLARAGLSQSVKIVGGNRVADGYVVTGAVKGDLIAHLRNVDKRRVFAFGDGPLDIGMLKNANEAIVVVGEQSSRSKSMESELESAIDQGLRARQVLLPSQSTIRLTEEQLPLVKFTEPEFLESIFAFTITGTTLKTRLATDRPSTKLLMTPTRKKQINGPELRESHRLIGRYLATEFLTEPDIIGLEHYAMDHVQGNSILGYRLLDESKTVIVALMRGGEPMALGVNDAFPLASFKHASSPKDIGEIDLDERVTVILVDSVINTGASMIEFLEHIRALSPTIRIVIVANVIQNEFIDEERLLKVPKDLGALSLVALRVSTNKYKGTKDIDTGNRLFNTKHLP
ncbi:hypothetical protein G7Y79_00001g000170 [Physcia stellaris]|nr:hypothetical protein G7Y79_00001g000170 [Physcia stellaris]